MIACKYERFDGHLEERSTLNMIFSVTYHLELCKGISIDLEKSYFTQKNGCLDIIVHKQLYLVKTK